MCRFGPIEASEPCRISDEFVRSAPGITLCRIGDAIGLAFERLRFSSGAGVLMW
jgi:hypothetical protein